MRDRERKERAAACRKPCEHKLETKRAANRAKQRGGCERKIEGPRFPRKSSLEGRGGWLPVNTNQHFNKRGRKYRALSHRRLLVISVQRPTSTLRVWHSGGGSVAAPTAVSATQDTTPFLDRGFAALLGFTFTAGANWRAF